MSKPRKFLPCDECVHWLYEPYDDYDEKYNPCTKGHKMKFRMPWDPNDPHATDWGFHRPGCQDREVKPMTTPKQ